VMASRIVLTFFMEWPPCERLPPRRLHAHRKKQCGDPAGERVFKSLNAPRVAVPV
jgi:hypothetical protein